MLTMQVRGCVAGGRAADRHHRAFTTCNANSVSAGDNGLGFRGAIADTSRRKTVGASIYSGFANGVRIDFE